MKVVTLEYPVNYSELSLSPSVLAMGFFDGVHLGHQKVIGKAKEIAIQKNYKLAVMTFNQSPATVYGGQNEKTFKYLSTLDRKIELFESLGVDVLYVTKFTKNFSILDPQKFVDLFMTKLNAKVVVAGFDYTYGKKEVANMTNLPKFSNGNFEVVKVDKLELENTKVGTSSIKQLISEGKVSKANEKLGYTYQNKGIVVHGLKRGRQLGFPTANLKISKNEQIPGFGVYVTKVLVDGKWHEAMTSVGLNITFGDIKEMAIEANIFDFSKDIYGEEVKIKWYKKLRNEAKFANVEELIEQLKQDEIDTKNYFQNLR